MPPYYLLDNPPRVSQFRTARRAKPSGLIVVHTAESEPDEHGPDDGAANVAAFIRNRKKSASYHALADSDSRTYMVPWHYEAFHDGTGSNAFSIGISVATQAHRWSTLSPRWRDGAITQLAVLAAEAALWLRNTYGIVVPSERVSKGESDRRHAGFISHGERDPGRRSDPGKDFPWDSFLERYDYFMRLNGVTPDVVEPPVAEAPFWTGMIGPGQYLTSGNGRYLFIHQTDGNLVLYDGQRPIWSSRTLGARTSALVMQGDGNLVLIGDRVYWAAGTDGHPGAVLRVQNDGNVVIYGPGNKPLWSSRSSH